MPEPVTVFYGPNEAGKSTLLAFIRAILFGFPPRFNAHYPPLSGGRHGGRITLSDSTGAMYAVERYAGARGGLGVSGADGPMSSVDAVMRRLTGNATPDIFRNVFAFSLDELQAASSLNDSSGAIYSVGQGSPGLPALQKSLTEQRQKIYRPSGSNQDVPRLVNALREIDGQLRVIEGNAVRYGWLIGRKSEIDSELQGADAELTRLGAQQSEIGRLASGWDDWLALSACEGQLRDIPKYLDFPENPIVRLDGFENQARQLREDRDESARLLRQAEEAASADILSEDLLCDRELVEAIRRDRNRFDAAVRDLPERRGELRKMEDDLAGNLADLGHDWGEAELQQFDTSLVIRNQVASWKERIAEAGDRAQKAEFQLAQERRTLADHELGTGEARDTLPPDPPLSAAALSERQEVLRAARSRLGDYERHSQNHETLRGQLNALAASQETTVRNSGRISLLPIIVLVLGGAVLPVAGILIGGGALILGIVCGLIFMIAATLLWFMRRPTPPSVDPSPMASALVRQAADAETAAESVRQSLMASASALGLRGQPDAAVLDSAEERVNLARNALEARNAGNARVADAVRRERMQQQRLEQTIKEHQAADVSAQEMGKEWGQWLSLRGLDESLTPDAMTTFLARVETARGALAEIHRMRDRVAAIEHDIQEFKGLVDPLATRHGLPLDPDDRRQLAIVADELIRRLDESQTAFSDRERAREQVEENRQLLEGWERRLQSAEQELAALLEAGGTEDTEEFRRRARQNEERLELERRLDEHRRSLERMSGPGERFEAFRKALAGADPDRLQEESERLSELHGEASALRDALREERGGIDTELAQLSGEEESSALRIRRNVLEEQLQEHAREWSRLTIAEALLEKTRHKFEQERQPSVIRHAQDFFSGVTGQRYDRLYAPIGEQTITVTDATGASKQPGVMSRGTREQLYLALRFGLIREFGEHAERLPVVVDEALVNFDPGRARLAAESFAQLSETNQVLVFTCHPTTADMFADAAGAQVVDISR